MTRNEKDNVEALTECVRDLACRCWTYAKQSEFQPGIPEPSNV